MHSLMSCYFVVVGELVSSHDPESYTGGTASPEGRPDIAQFRTLLLCLKVRTEKSYGRNPKEVRTEDVCTGPRVQRDKDM